MVYIACNNGDQAKEEYDSGGVDNRVQWLNAWRGIFHSAEILKQE